MLSQQQISEVIALLEKAGKEILGIYKLEDFGTRLKDDLSPVTIADIASDETIKSGLEKITPGIPVFSEETKEISYTERSKWKVLWILDPLDGTKEFIARNDEFCISLALISGNSPEAGFIHAPVTGELWIAERGSGAYKIVNNIKHSLPLITPAGPFRINKSRTHHTINEEAWIEEFRKKHDVIIMIHGSALKFCKIAEGHSDIYPKLSPIHEWDISAGHLIVEESGGRIIEPGTGQPPRYNKEDYRQPAFIAFGCRIRDWQKWVPGSEHRAQGAE